MFGTFNQKAHATKAVMHNRLHCNPTFLNMKFHSISYCTVILEGAEIADLGMWSSEFNLECSFEPRRHSQPTARDRQTNSLFVHIVSIQAVSSLSHCTTTMMDVSTKNVLSNKALKVAKKSLKKQDTKSMKLKVLAKLVSDSVGVDKATHKMVKKWIKASDTFSVEGKKVFLSKRKRDSSVPALLSDKKARKSNDIEATPTWSSQESLEDISKWRKENKIMVMDYRDDETGKQETTRLNESPTFFPFSTFDDAKCQEVLAGSLLRQCTEGNGFKRPSPIQAQSWPIMMSKRDDGCQRDIVGIAETGSGKTLAFAMPVLSSMVASTTNGKHQPKTRRSPRMLVLAPTRELAMQSDAVLQEFGSVVGIRSLVVCGGVARHTQAAELQKKTIDCVVATPGRIKDLVHDGICDLSQIDHLILDEADRYVSQTKGQIAS